MLGSAARTGLKRAFPPRRPRTDRPMLPLASPSRRPPAPSRAVLRGSAGGARPPLGRAVCPYECAWHATHACPPKPVAECTIRLDARPRVVEEENRLSSSRSRFWTATRATTQWFRLSQRVAPLPKGYPLVDPTAMHAFAHRPAYAARWNRVARRFPSLPRRLPTSAPESVPRPGLVPRLRDARSARLTRLGVAPRASAEDARRARMPREARRDVHAPRSYTAGDSVDGDESYSLLDAKSFGPAETDNPVGSTWGGDDARRVPFGSSPASGGPAAWADRPDVVTASSTHVRHPHVVSVKLPRPVSDHVKLAPRTSPPLASAFAELRVRPRVRVKNRAALFRVRILGLPVRLRSTSHVAPARRLLAENPLDDG